MNSQKDQESLWKDDSDQLKKDLKSRQKKVVRREVDIKVAKPGQEYAKTSTNESPTTIKQPSEDISDDLIRKQLGL